MKRWLSNTFKRIKPDKKESPYLHTTYDAFYTFLFTPPETTHGGVHIRDGMDLKRTMVHVVLALTPLYLFGMWNIGQQHYNAMGLYEASLTAFHLKLAYGLIKIAPIFIVTHVVGLGIEFFFAAKRGHAVEEGFLVTGALIPLIMPPDIPLWMLSVAIAFAVIIGKEAFGGTGMNILNVALLARAFVFFAYPSEMAGDTMGSGREVWVAGLTFMEGAQGQFSDYGWLHGVFDTLFGWLGMATFGDGGAAVVDGFTGATPMGLAAKQGWEGVLNHYTTAQMMWGSIPGSIGETCKPLILAGAAFLLFTGIGSWRIMLSMFGGAVVTALLLYSWGASPFMQVPPVYQFFMGSFFFAMAFMATDPVTASTTEVGKLIYGFLIGVIGMLVRVINPAYPEGWMLAILFMNVFAPLIDHYVLESNMKKRLKRA